MSNLVDRALDDNNNTSISDKGTVDLEDQAEVRRAESDDDLHCTHQNYEAVTHLNKSKVESTSKKQGP